jgi:hypothetical protein
MKQSLTIQSIVTVTTFLSASTTVYRKPAHHRTPHHQYGYRNYHPSQRGSGHFESENRSLVPWEAHKSTFDDAAKLNSETNHCPPTTDGKPGTFWLANIVHQGKIPSLSDSLE